MQIRNISMNRRNIAVKVGLAALAVAAVMIFGGRIILQAAGIIFGAAVIAFILAPLCRLLERRLPRPLAAITALAGSVLILIGGLGLLLPALLRQLTVLMDILPEAFRRIGTLADGAATWLQAQLPGFTLPELNLSGMENTFADAARGAISTVSGLADGIYRIFLMATLAYFLLADRERVLLRLELMAPAVWRKFAVRAGGTLVRELRLYLRGQATIALAVGTLASAVMLVTGLRGALLLGMTVGIFNVIPYFGPFLGGIPAVVTALGMSWQRAAITVLALFLVQQADGMLISPRVMGNITGFSPAVVLIAIFIGARMGGIGGMLFALPALLAIRTLYRVFVQRHENN